MVNIPFLMIYFFFCTQAVEEEDKMTPEQLAIKNVGKQVMCPTWLILNFLSCLSLLLPNYYKTA